MFNTIYLIPARSNLVAVLRNAGFNIYCGTDHDHDHDDIVAVAHDLDAIRDADAIVLALPTNRYGRMLASHGACTGKPTVVLADGPGRACQVGTTHFVTNIDEMLSALKGDVGRLLNMPWWE
jgi:predicted dinucleotide-binding enzyme